MNANISSHVYDPIEDVILRTHPPVIRTRKAASGTGELGKGLIVAENSSEEIIPYDPDGGAPADKPVGVLVRNCSLDHEDIARYMVHGSVRRSKLIVGESGPDADDIRLLEDLGIWPESDPMND